MTASQTLEEPPVFVRVFEEPKNKAARREFSQAKPNDRLMLVFDTETTTDTKQELRLGFREFCTTGSS